MVETPKLSVEKALEKLRAADAPKSKNARRTEEMDALDEEIKRLRALPCAHLGGSASVIETIALICDQPQREYE